MDADHRMLKPYTREQLFEAFLAPSGSINKHLLTIYSLVVGLNTQRVVDIGAGSTTRAIRAALEITGGQLQTCDIDREKYQHLLDQPTESFRFHACDSRTFIEGLEGPLDFVLHDGAHDHLQVRWDLERLWPLVRQYGLICVHDTQNSTLGTEMQRGMRDAFRGCAVSWTHLPFCYGLTIIRIERPQPWEPIDSPYMSERHALDGIVNFNTPCGLTDPDAVVRAPGRDPRHRIARMRSNMAWLGSRMGKLVSRAGRLVGAAR